MNCLAQEIIILLYRDAPKDQTIDDRSLSMEPTVSHDRNVIYIHSDIAIENMQITIRDKYKDINIDINDNVTDEIVDKCEFYEFGARRIDKIISKDIENVIIDGVIRGDKDIYIDSIVKKNITS